MSNLYKETLVEAAKLREIAEQDAKNSIIDAITPFIKKMILNETTNGVLEQTLPNVEDTENLEQLTAVEPQSNPEMADPVTGSEVDSLQTQDNSQAPISPASSGADLVNVSLPDESGKIIVDFEKLFLDNPNASLNNLDLGDASLNTPDVTDAVSLDTTLVPTDPSPGATLINGPPEEMKISSLNEFKSVYGDISQKVDKLYYAPRKISDLTQESIKNKLLTLLESSDKLFHEGKISSNQMKLNEKALEFLFFKLKEANLQNSYMEEKENVKDISMNKTLKEFAANLFENEDQESLEQDSVSSGDTGVAVHHDATAHAEKVSGVSPEVGDLFKEDSSDVFFEVDEKELQEAIRQLKKENMSRKMKSLDESKEGWEQGKPKKDDASKSVLKKESADMDSAAVMDEDLVLNVDLPDELESEMEEDDLDVDFEFSDDEEDLEVEDMDSDGSDDLELGSDDMESDMDVDVSSGEEDMVLSDDDMDTESDDSGLEVDDEEVSLQEMNKKLRESNRRLQKKLSESRKELGKLTKLAEVRSKNVVNLRKELNETNLFVSKLVYLNKFFQQEGLSKKQKQQIVEHLDRATNLKESKEIYKKIKNKLNEAMETRNPSVLGSASKATTAGSSNSLLENSSNGSSEANEQTLGTFDRWQQLAKINKGKKE